MTSEHMVHTDDGEALRVRRLPAANQARGVALLLHAMMVDGRTMDRPVGAGLGSTLASAGWEVLIADFRGRGDGGQGGYDDLVFQDVPALIRAARQVANGRPVVVVGHSLGGHVSVATLGLGLAKADALVLVAANVWDLDLEPSPVARWVKSTMMTAFESLTVAVGRFPARALGVGSSDESMPYVRDLARYVREGRWRSRDGVWDYDAAAGHVDVPVLAVLGRGDRWLGRNDAAAAWASGVGDGPELWVVGGGRHGVEHDPGHMGLVLDAACRPWWERLATWLEDHGMQRPVQDG